MTPDESVFFISIFQIGITIIPLMWDAEWPKVIIKNQLHAFTFRSSIMSNSYCDS